MPIHSLTAHTVVATGKRYKQHRRTAKQSQSAVAELAEISVRHLSYIENGHSTPSRYTVDKLCQALALTPNDSNQLLRGWGHLVFIPSIDLSHKENAAYLTHVERILAANAHIPTIAMSSGGNILALNDLANSILKQLDQQLNSPISNRFSEQNQNLFDLILSDEGIKPAINNWAQLAPRVITHMQQGQSVLDPNSPPWQLLNTLLTRYADSCPIGNDPISSDLVICFELDLNIGGVSHKYISYPLTLGTPYDATGQNIRLELFYPR